LVALLFTVARSALFAAEAALFAVAAVRTRTAVLPIVAAFALLSRLALLALVALLPIVARLVFTGVGELLVALVIVEVLAALAALVLEARAAFAQHAEIMVCELQIIFGLDPVARELRIARHALVLLEQLSGIAALAIVLPVARLSAEIRSPLAPTAAPAAALSIVDQVYVLTK
jgi:hypothetical protein